MGRVTVLVGLAAALLLPTTAVTAAPSSASEEESDYIVVSRVEQQALQGNISARSIAPPVRQVRSLTSSEAAQLRERSDTVSVELDLPLAAHQDSSGNVAGSASVVAPRQTISWGLDRIDQPIGVDGWYRPTGDGSGALAYLVDGSVANHPEFDDRLLAGKSFVAGSAGGSCDRHGTHVAGVVGSSRYGVAASVSLIPVRVLDCAGAGTSSDLLDAIDWIIADHKSRGSGPAVANLSLGAAARSDLIDQAIASLAIAGILPVVSAGNQRSDACQYSPAASPAAISVAASTRSDSEASFSNWGSCLEIYAPGQSIVSTHYDSAVTTGTVMSGTSQAAPYVAGVAAVLWGLEPQLTVTQIREKVLSASRRGVLTFVRPTVGSPDALVSLTGSAGSAPATSPQENTEMLQAPKRVKRLWVKARGNRNVVVKFRGVKDANRYRFEVKRQGSDKWRGRGTTQDRKYRIKRLRQETTYRLRVTAKNRIGLSQPLTRKIRTR